MKLSREVLTNKVLSEFSDSLARNLFKLQTTYPGGNTELLGKQLIQLLKLKEGVSGFKDGVLYTLYGEVKGGTTLVISVLQPQADTEKFEFDLTEFDKQFCALRDKEWNK